MWSNRAWQSRLWCLMGLQSTLSSICVSLQVTGHRSRPAIEHRKRQRSRHRAQQPWHHPAPQHVWAREQLQPPANTTPALAKKRQGLISEPLLRARSSRRKGMGRGSWKTQQEPEWHRQKELHSTDYPGLLNTSNSGEGHFSFPSPNSLGYAKGAKSLHSDHLFPGRDGNLAFHSRQDN